MEQNYCTVPSSVQLSKEDGLGRFLEKFWLFSCFSREVSTLSGFSACPGTLLAESREYNLEQQRTAQCETLSPWWPAWGTARPPSWKAKCRAGKGWQLPIWLWRVGSGTLWKVVLPDFLVIFFLLSEPVLFLSYICTWPYFSYMCDFPSEIPYPLLTQESSACSKCLCFDALNICGATSTLSRFDVAENVVIVASREAASGWPGAPTAFYVHVDIQDIYPEVLLEGTAGHHPARDDTRRANKKAKQTGRLGMELGVQLRGRLGGGKCRAQEGRGLMSCLLPVWPFLKEVMILKMLVAVFCISLKYYIGNFTRASGN